MTSRFALAAGGIATILLLSFTASGAAAQCRLCDTPSTVPSTAAPEAPVDLQIESSLDFDWLVLAGSGDGTATLLPDGNRGASGSIVGVNGRAMVGSATVRGEPGKFVRIGLPRMIEMHSISGGAIVMDQIVSDLPSLPRLDASGVLRFRFGGQLRVNGDAGGDYRGNIPIMVEYL